ncbi:type IV secretion system protein [Neisseria dentiae]|nr:type IV secretion system protein [Neisseria dentiae]
MFGQSCTGTVREWLNGNIKDNIARMISGSEYGSPEAMVDASLMMMHMVTAMFGGLHTAVGTESGGASAMTTFITMSGVGQGAPAVVAGSLLLLNQIAISLCILTAPAFILCLLYEPTKQYFQGWLKFFLGALLTLGVLSAMVVIGLKVTLAYGAGVLAQYATSQALGSGGSGIAQTAMTQGGLGLMMSTLMITAPMMVGNMIGASLGGFSGFNMFSRTETPRDANGNVMPQTRTQQNITQGADSSLVNPGNQSLTTKQSLISNGNFVKQAGESQRGVAS